MSLEGAVDPELAGLNVAVHALDADMGVCKRAGLEEAAVVFQSVLGTALGATMDAVGEEVAQGERVKAREGQRGHLGNAEKREYEALHKKKMKTAAAVRQLFCMDERGEVGALPPAVVELF